MSGFRTFLILLTLGVALVNYFATEPFVKVITIAALVVFGAIYALTFHPEAEEDPAQRDVLRGLPDEWEHIATATLPHTEVDRQRAQVWRQCADELRRALHRGPAR